MTALIVEPRLGAYDPTLADESVERTPSLQALSASERRGVRNAAFAAVLVAVFFAWLAGPQLTLDEKLLPGPTAHEVAAWSAEELEHARAAAEAASGDARTFAVPRSDGLAGMLNRTASALPYWGVLRDPVHNSLMPSPFLKSIVAMILVFFVVPGFVYGRTVGTMRSERAIIDGMAAAMSSMGLYIVLVFFAAQFVAFFKWTNLGAILAVVGADALAAMGLDNAAVFVPFIVMRGFVNLMLGSASAQWAVTAPIFVPMLMHVGYSPERRSSRRRTASATALRTSSRR